MFVAMMSPEIKPSEVTEQSEGQLNLPKYEDKDKFIGFIDENLKFIYIVFLLIFLLSGIWR